MILYHYCSVATLHAILGQRTIRLSSLTQSNDYMEGKLVSAAVLRLGQADGLSDEEIRRIQDDLDMLESSYAGLGFCLSREGDLLSQWRGYANDGSGVALGFSKDFLHAIAQAANPDGASMVYLEEVRYKDDEHDKLVRPAYDEVRSRMRAAEWRPPGLLGMGAAAIGKSLDDIRKERFSANMNISLAALSLLDHSFLLKAFGFREEREWRLISHCVNKEHDISDFRPTMDQLIPFREIRIPSIGPAAMPELILGSKHRTPDTVIRDFLRKAGLEGTKIHRSKTSYR